MRIILTISSIHRIGYLEANGQTSTDLYKVALLADRMDGYFSVTETGMIPIEAIEVCQYSKMV